MEQFALKPTIYFGPDALSALEALSGRRVMVVTDGFLASSGLLERVKAHLRDCAVEVFDAVKPDPSLRLVAEGAAALAAFRPEALVAFGGGSPMDCAKAMRHFAPLAGPLPLWCVPTTAGTGSEVTSFAVLTDTDAGVKYPLVDGALLPDAAVLDASLLAGVPPAVTADTGMDVLTHAAEAYVARGANAFTDALAEKAFVLAYRSLPEAQAQQGESPARERMLQASCLAGIAFNAAGLGLSHALAHALGGRYHVPHGRLNALLLPHVLRFNGEDPRAAEKYARLAGLCGLAKNGRALAAALSRMRAGLGMPETLSACGVEGRALRADLEALAAAAMADVCLPGNPRPATQEALKTLLKELV